MLETSTPPLTDATTVPPAPARRSESDAFPDTRSRRRYWILLGVLVVLSCLFAVGTLVWDNPMPFGSAGFWRITEMRRPA